jgi:signal transduction histidine kinase
MDRWTHRRRRARRLQSRLFLWFLSAILLALGASTATLWLTHANEPHEVGAFRTALHTVGNRVAARWDDPPACAAYLAELHESLGIELHLRRDPQNLPHLHMAEGDSIAFDRRGHGFVPVFRHGALVGAVELDAGPMAPHIWNVLAALGAALFALSFAARGVSRRLSWPLEVVANAAERFGGGDLTTRTNLDRSRRHHWVAEEVREVARAFDTMAERIEGVVRDQRELLGAISHELRSPLGRARIALEIARERSPETVAPTFDELERQLAEVDAILGDLLAVARAGLSDLHLEPTPLFPWLRARIASEPGRPPIELTTPDEEELTVELDAALMNRALHNLFANASAHGHPESQPIVVHVTRDGGTVRIAVRDRGPGFPPELLGRIFNPFVKGDAARTPGTGVGTGLGLALVRRIAEAHRGKASAQNVGKDDAGDAVTGAEVSIELPVVRVLK